MLNFLAIVAPVTACALLLVVVELVNLVRAHHSLARVLTDLIHAHNALEKEWRRTLERDLASVVGRPPSKTTPPPPH